MGYSVLMPLFYAPVMLIMGTRKLFMLNLGELSPAIDKLTLCQCSIITMPLYLVNLF